jgi:hypothetical protein
MNPGNFSAFSQGSTYSYYYTTGQVSTGRIDANLAAGTYYLVFQNTNTNRITEDTVTITQSIVASGTPQG